MKYGLKARKPQKKRDIVVAAYAIGEVDKMAFGFSWKRALGITSAKRKIAKITGIPTTKAGRRNKARKLLVNALVGKPKRRRK